jgi:hypothetical protein
MAMKTALVVGATGIVGLLNAVSRSGSVHHVALVTGLKHYLGPFEAYGKGTLPATPFREEQARLAIEGFFGGTDGIYPNCNKSSDSVLRETER